MEISQDRYRKPQPAFATWLLKQRDRTDDIGRLAKAASLDPGFPANGDFDAVSARLNILQADPEMHVALEDAELDWSCY